MRDVMTVEQAAEYLQMHVETVRRHCRNAKLPAVKIGGQWRLYRKQLVEWFRNSPNEKIS